MTPTESKKLESAEAGKSRATNKLDKLMDRSRTVGGVVAGAALGAILDRRIKAIWGLPPSLFFGAVGIGAVAMGYVKSGNGGNDELVLALGLGMIAPVVHTRTKAALQLANLFGGNGNGNGNGNGTGG